MGTDSEGALEAIAPKDKRKSIEATIVKVIKLMDPSGMNSDEYVKIFSSMSDAEFDRFMRDIRDGKRKLIIYAPNMKNTLKVENLLKAAKSLKVPLFERMKIWDPIGKRYYTTPNPYMVLRLPIRRLKQFLFDKISIPESDKTINQLTGQVTKPDKGSAVSGIELQTIASKGLDNTIVELATVRGGNPDAYAGFRAALEETGDAHLSEVDPNQRVRSAEIASVYFESMMIDNNL